MKEMELYLGETYRNNLQPTIMTEKLSTFPNQLIPPIIPDTSAERTKTYMEMTYLKNRTIDEAIHQKLRKKDVYEIYMHKI